MDGEKYDTMEVAIFEFEVMVEFIENKIWYNVRDTYLVGAMPVLALMDLVNCINWEDIRLMINSMVKIITKL